MRTLLLNLALFTASFGMAQGGGPAPVAPVPPGLIGPGYGICGPIANVVYDCPSGPGYLRLTAVNVYGEKNSKQVYTGSREVCLYQAGILFAKRSQIASPKILALCSATQNTLIRYQFNQLGQSVALPQVQMPTMEECLSNAKATNELP